MPDSLDGALVSNDFPAFNINQHRAFPRFLGWLSTTRDFWGLCRTASEGTTNRVRLVCYLLSASHPHGRHKGSFFGRFGFSLEHWKALASALSRHAASYDTVKVEDTPFGTRYAIESELAAPDGRRPLVRSVWFIENGEDFSRFVTAYPLARREG